MLLLFYLCFTTKQQYNFITYDEYINIIFFLRMYSPFEKNIFILVCK